MGACERDKRLPTGLEKEITDAKAKTGPKGAMHLLSKMFAECDDLSEETSMMFKVASEMLTSQDEADAMLLSEEPRVQLENLNTTATLTRLRKDIDSLKERMDKAEQVTRELRIRFHEAAPELGMIDKPLKDLESKMPHLDGTPLEVEPCVPALYALFEQLDELKAESAAAIAAAKALRDAACSADSLDTLGEELHRLSLSSSEVSLDAVVDERMEGFKAVSSDCDERQEKRVKLLKQVEEQHAIFKTAKCAATEFYERREYLGRARALPLQQSSSPGSKRARASIRRCRLYRSPRAQSIRLPAMVATNSSASRRTCVWSHAHFVGNTIGFPACSPGRVDSHSVKRSRDLIVNSVLS